MAQALTPQRLLQARSLRAAKLSGGLSERHLEALDPVVCTVHSLRGWRASPLQASLAWSHVEQEAREAGWADHFQPECMSDKALEALGRLIEASFLGCCLHDLPAALPSAAPFGRSQHGAQPAALRYKVEEHGQSLAGHDGWLTCYHDRCIHVLRHKWVQPVSPATPASCEGCVCTSRLQLLLHSLGHELVHALVDVALPPWLQDSPAYLARAGHGPIFKLLNKQLFGHSSESYHMQPRGSSGVPAVPLQLQIEPELQLPVG